MASVSAHAVAARLRRRIDPRAGRRGLLEQGGRIAAILFGGSAAIALLLQMAWAIVGPVLADPLALPSAVEFPPATSTWAYVLFESCLLPHRLPGSAWSIWGGGSVALMIAAGVYAFAAGRDQLMRPIDLPLLALPAAAAAVLVALADAVAGGGWEQVLFAPLAAVSVAAAGVAGAAWRLTRYARGAAPYLRAVMAAGWAVPVMIAVAAPAVMLAPAGVEPGGIWIAALLPFAPGAVLRGALNGVGAADSVGLVLMLAAAAAIASVLNRRSVVERTAFAVALGAMLTALTAASTPVGSAGAALQVVGRSLPAALVIGILAAAFGPYLGVLRAGHSLAGAGFLRELGDRMPPPAASEIFDVSAVALGPVGGAVTATAAVAAAAPAAARTARPAARGRLPRARVRPPRVESAPAHAQRLGRIAAGVAATLAALLALTAAVAVIMGGAPSDGTPELTAVQSYLQAAGAGDASRAWSFVNVDTSGLPATAQPRLLERDDFARMLALPANRGGAPTGVRLDVIGRSSGATLVHARFTDSNGAREETLRVVRVGSAYRVQFEPAGLSLPATGGGRVTVDGSALTPGAAPVAVFPGTHHVAVDYPAPFASAAADVRATGAYSDPVAVPVGARLDDVAMAAARSAVAAALRACAAASSARPAGCPQGIDAPVGSTVRWTLVGDAAQSLAVLPDGRGGVVAHGQFAMVGAYDVHIPEDVKHVASGGSFRAPLTWNNGRWSVSGSVDPETADVPRPSVPDADVLAAVRAGFDHCTTTPLLRPADCPQTEPSQYFVRDVAWSLAGDPISGATVTFDARHALFNVSGTYAMAVHYVEGGDAKNAQSSGRYRADLFWDGQRLMLVAINRA